MGQTNEEQRSILMRNIATELSRRTGIVVDALDYDDWLEGGNSDRQGDDNGFDKFDKVVEKLLGSAEYERWDISARLNLALICKLGDHDLNPENIYKLEKETNSCKKLE